MQTLRCPDPTSRRWAWAVAPTLPPLPAAAACSPPSRTCARHLCPQLSSKEGGLSGQVSMLQGVATQRQPCWPAGGAVHATSTTAVVLVACTVPLSPASLCWMDYMHMLCLTTAPLLLLLLLRRTLYVVLTSTPPARTLASTPTIKSTRHVVRRHVCEWRSDCSSCAIARLACVALLCGRLCRRAAAPVDSLSFFPVLIPPAAERPDRRQRTAGSPGIERQLEPTACWRAALSSSRTSRHTFFLPETDTSSNAGPAHARGRLAAAAPGLRGIGSATPAETQQHPLQRS